MDNNYFFGKNNGDKNGPVICITDPKKIKEISERLKLEKSEETGKLDLSLQKYLDDSAMKFLLRLTR